jgi:hypothetical protein
VNNLLNRVTFTGVDDKTNIDDLVYLTEKYPFVEFGILVSKNNSNNGTVNRYPNLTILKRLKNKGLNLSCHICGSIARQIVQKNDWSELEILLGKDMEIFKRFQLNVSNIHKFSKEISFREGKDFIIQLKDDTSLYDYYKDLPNVLGFQDNSGGLGKFEDNWIDSDRYFGYAGGLSVENVEKVIEDLLIVNNSDFWIDMESSVRTNDRFDTKKCEEVLKICKKFVLN